LKFTGLSDKRPKSIPKGKLIFLQLDRREKLSEPAKTFELNGIRLKPHLSLLWLIPVGLILLSYGWLFAPTLPPLYRDWFEYKTFSHGLLVPFISCYLAWQKKAELQKISIASSPWGLLLIVPALSLVLVGRAIGDDFTERVALVLCLSGLVWLLFGWAVFKCLSFPLVYLLLMIPFPYVIVKEVAYHLRILNAAAAAPILRLLAVPVYRESYYLHLPNVTLEVADLCSGISSVFALFALGGAYVFFTPMGPLFKFLAIMSTFPFAVLINLLRIVITAALSYHVSLAVLGMLIHEMTGTITFFIALTLFILLCEFLQKRFGRKAMASSAKVIAMIPGDTMTPDLTPTQARQSWLPLGLAAALLAPTFYFANNISAQLDMRPLADLKVIAAQITGVRTGAANGSGDYKDSGAEFDWSGEYVSPGGQRTEMYVAFRGRQQGDKRLHSPKLQFPFGWNYVWAESARVPTSSHSVTANWMLTQNNQVRVLVLYWYQIGDRTFGGELEKRIELIRHSLLRGRSDSAIIRLATPVADSEKLEQAQSRLAALAAQLYPHLNQIFPQ
jgi:EpsI family protein